MGTVLWGTQEADMRPLKSRLDFPSCTGPIRPRDAEQVVVCWQVKEYRGSGKWMLNVPAYARRLSQPGELEKWMKLHQLPYDDSGKALYQMVVFHQEVLAVFRRETQLLQEPGLRHKGDGWKEVEWDPSRPALRKLSRLAKRGLYAIGLDFGTVGLSWDPQGEPVVVSATSALFSPLTAGYSGSEQFEQADRWWTRIADCLNAFHHHMEAEWTRCHHRHPTNTEDQPDWQMGTDLEFVMCAPSGRVLLAERWLGRKGTVGSDCLRTKEDRLIFPLAELRPQPARTPRELIQHIRKAMHEAAVKMQGTEAVWLAGGMPVKGIPLGGHLHFSGFSSNPFFVRALDNYLTLPLMLIEDDGTRKRRPKYGYPGDVRFKRHGGFEYRTPPSWIVSPRIAKGVAALADVIARHYWSLADRPLDDFEVAEAYYSGDKRIIYPVVQQLWKQLESTAAYSEHASYLIPFKKQIFQKQVWHADRDIRKAWRIFPFQAESISPSKEAESMI
ncbi:putative amidoligase domain-containing protein [Marinicrinis sediminis]|uniref:Phage phiEco32-like COOH-NH2 ligase-type 2 n=1 Tax=Marinicrinis sediminis TaxID=1652465 RepID=A0ABW5RD94_9BACL